MYVLYIFLKKMSTEVVLDTTFMMASFLTLNTFESAANHPLTTLAVSTVCGICGSKITQKLVPRDHWSLVSGSIGILTISNLICRNLGYITDPVVIPTILGLFREIGCQITAPVAEIPLVHLIEEVLPIVDEEIVLIEEFRHADIYM